MEPSLLVYGLLTFTVTTGYMTNLCHEDPPNIRYATFKAHSYKNGTLLICKCKQGFRRIQNVYIYCTVNSGHASWENKCQCKSSSSNTEKLVTLKPEEPEERKFTGIQSQMQSLDQVNLPGHCREPPSWEHEAVERNYHFVVGQTIQYQCIEGYRARQRGPAESTCYIKLGESIWTQPQLKCISEENPGTEEADSYTDALPQSETSYASITTVSQKQTEAVTTMETCLLTIQYQIAVASCVFLLISILLLSGFTWRQKWRKNRRTI